VRPAEDGKVRLDSTPPPGPFRVKQKYLQCIPVSVPHKSIGFNPVGPDTTSESVQTPAVVSVISKLSKSRRIWQISEKYLMKLLKGNKIILLHMWQILERNQFFSKQQKV